MSYCIRCIGFGPWLQQYWMNEWMNGMEKVHLRWTNSDDQCNFSLSSRAWPNWKFKFNYCLGLQEEKDAIRRARTTRREYRRVSQKKIITTDTGTNGSANESSKNKQGQIVQAGKIPKCHGSLNNLGLIVLRRSKAQVKNKTGQSKNRSKKLCNLDPSKWAWSTDRGPQSLWKGPDVHGS